MAENDAVGPFDTEPSLPDPLPAEPFELFCAWFEEARTERVTPNPNAMALATIDADGTPSARIVLCKGIDASGGSLVFYTNYESRKGRALDANPRAAAVFHWDARQRQARFEGRVERVSDRESDEYFRTRPWESRVGAWASEQSEPIGSREALMEQVASRVAGLDFDLAAAMRGESVDIPRPPHWGGFRIIAERVELWSGGSGRVHDRATWSRSGRDGAWSSTRLQP